MELISAVAEDFGMVLVLPRRSGLLSRSPSALHSPERGSCGQHRCNGSIAPRSIGAIDPPGSADRGAGAGAAVDSPIPSA